MPLGPGTRIGPYEIPGAIGAGGSGAEPVFGKPMALFADEYDFGQGISNPDYDVTPEGRFIMLRHGANAAGCAPSSTGRKS